VVDDFVGVVGGLCDVVAFGEISGFFVVSAHDDGKFGVVGFVKTGAAFYFADVAAAYDAPTYFVHLSVLCFCIV
jgi:hypothetical protein